MTASTVLRPRAIPEGQADSKGRHLLDLLRYEALPYTIRLHRHDRLVRITSRADYLATLKLLLGFHRPLDRWIAGTLRPYAAELQLTRRAKAPLLARDFEALGAAPGALRFQPAPLSESAPYAMGWLYGIEVVTLGGRPIARRLQSELGLDGENGAAYFNGYGAEAGEAWSALTATLSRRVHGKDDSRTALDGALDMYQALSDWLSLT